MGGWSSSNNVFAPVSTSQSLRPPCDFFKIFSTFFRHRFFHRFCRLWGPLRAPFSTLFPTFSHHLLLFLAFRFYIVFSMPFEWILASFLMTFWMTVEEIAESVKFMKSMVFPNPFIDFIMIWGSILVKHSTPLRLIGDHFGICVRCRIFHDCLMPFWLILGPRSRERTAIPDVTFFILFLVFSGSRSGD